MRTKSTGLLVNRTDRLGARLGPIANAYFLSQRYGTHLYVYWRRSSGLEQPEDIFSRSFIEQCFVDEPPDATPLTTALVEVDICNFHLIYRSNDIISEDVLLINSAYGIYYDYYDDQSLVASTLSRYVYSDIISHYLLAAIHDAKLALGQQYVSVHIRRGDLKDVFIGHPKEIVPRYCPIEMIDFVAARHDNVVIFTDSVDTIPHRYRAFLADARIPHTLVASLSSIQLDLFHMLIMAGSKEIFAAKSAFSSTASLLGGTPIRHPLFAMPPRQYIDSFRCGDDNFFGNSVVQQKSLIILAITKALCSSKKWARALKACDYYITLFPDDPKGYLAKGHYHMYRGQYAAAESSFRSSAAIENSPDTSVALARSLHSQRKHLERDQILEKAMLQFPSDPNIISYARKVGKLT